MEVKRAPSMLDAPEHAASIRTIQRMMREPRASPLSAVPTAAAVMLLLLGTSMFALALAIRLAPDSVVSATVLAWLA